MAESMKGWKRSHRYFTDYLLGEQLRIAVVQEVTEEKEEA